MLYTIHIPDIIGNNRYKDEPVVFDVQKDTIVAKNTFNLKDFTITITTGYLSELDFHNYIVYDDEFTRDLVYQDLMNKIQSL